MAKIEFDLKDGITVGGQQEKHVVLRELTAGDIIDAGEESEKVVYSPRGEPTMVQSSVIMGAQIMCRQVAKLGTLQGPLDLDFLKKFTEADFSLLQLKCAELDSVAKKEVEVLNGRGRESDGSAGN